MNSFRFVDKQTGYLAAAFALLLAFILPALAFAAQVTERSVALSSSSTEATGVTYQVNFTAAGDAAAFIVDFCSNSPVVGQACTAPGGFSVSSATTATAGFTRTVLDANTIQLTGDFDADDEVSVELANVTNPTAAGPLYARIVTYDTSGHAALYAPAALGTGATDDGGVAISITPTIAVSGAVLESMTFCLTGAVAPGENCNLTGTSAPTLQLGQNTGGVIALDTADVYTGVVYTQLSTNAAAGAIVSLKSSAAGCGGLIRAGAASPSAGCGIAPAQATGTITAGQARFGVKTATAAGVGSNSNGTLRPYDSGSGAYYSNTVYKLRYVDGTDGVTSTYGDPFLDTNGAPANNMSMEVTFGASISNSTPAGTYSADLSMIATGKF